MAECLLKLTPAPHHNAYHNLIVGRRRGKLTILVVTNPIRRFLFDDARDRKRCPITVLTVRPHPNCTLNRAIDNYQFIRQIALSTGLLIDQNLIAKLQEGEEIIIAGNHFIPGRLASNR